MAQTPDPTQQQQTTPATPPPPTRSPEELKQSTKNMFSALWGEEAAKIVDEPDPSAPAPAPTAPAPTPAPAPAPAPEPEPKALTAEELITQTASATAKAVADTMRQPSPAPAPAPAPEPEFQVRPDDRRDFEALRFMADANPQQYGKKFADYQEYLKKLYAYETQWEKDNPGQKFDAESDEHAEFYENNEPEITDDELQDASIQMNAERLYNERMAPELKKIKQKQIFEENAIPYATKVMTTIHNFVKNIDPNLGELLMVDGKITLDDKAAERVRQHDPIAAEIIEEAIHGRFEPMIRELELAAIEGLDYKLQPSKNPVHAEIARYINEQEAHLRNLPADQRAMNGKEWLTVADHQRRQEEIIHSRRSEAEKEAQLKALNDRYWSLTFEQVEDLMIDRIGNEVKGRIQKENSRAERKFGPRTTTQSPPATTQPQPTPQPANTGSKPRPPSISTSSDLVTTPNSGQPSSQTRGDKAIAAMFAR